MTDDRPDSYKQLDKSFTITPNHIKLLRRLNIAWLRYAYDGAPGVAPKRPFGNSAIEPDIAEIIGEPTPDWENASPEEIEAFRDKMRPWFRQMDETLQIAAQCGQLLPGKYERKFPGDWHAVEIDADAVLSAFNELLAACKDSLPFVEGSGYGAISERVASRIKSAIAKAEGVING